MSTKCEWSKKFDGSNASRASYTIFLLHVQFLQYRLIKVFPSLSLYAEDGKNI